MIAELSPEAYYSDFKRFIYRCSELGLNPLQNDAHLDYRFHQNKARALTVIHIDGYRKIADQSGELDGFDQELGQDARGEFVKTTIWRKGRVHPFVSRVYFDEFMQSGEYSIYRSKPYHMVSKCGAALCYKIAFPVSGMTLEEEAESWIDPAETDTIAASRKPADNPYTVAESGPDSEPESSPEPADDDQPEPAPTAPAPSVKSDREVYSEIANEMLTMGVEAATIKNFLDRYFGDDKKSRKDPKANIEAIRLARDFVKEKGTPAFRAQVENRAFPLGSGPAQKKQT